ncbi:LOW QUALITY PROTEIN: hypothetical protein HID58_067562, partial [Brassica napus]
LSTIVAQTEEADETEQHPLIYYSMILCCVQRNILSCNISARGCVLVRCTARLRSLYCFCLVRRVASSSGIGSPYGSSEFVFFFGGVKVSFGGGSISEASRGRHLFLVTISRASVGLRPHLNWRLGLLCFILFFTVDKSEQFARQTHCYFGSRRRQEASRLCHAVAVSLLCSSTIPCSWLIVCRSLESSRIGVWHRGQVLLCTDLVVEVASTCLVGRRFQTLCGVVYKPGFGGDCKAHVSGTPLFVVWSFRDSDGYKFGGVRWELATPETTREVPASETIRRTSPSSDSRRWLRTVTDSEEFRR